MPVDLYWSDDTDNRLMVNMDDEGPRDVFICSLHKEAVSVPFFDEWTDSKLKSWLGQYEPVPNAKQDNSDFGDELDAVARDDRWGLQATYNDYQLYIYSGEDTGEVPGFWEFAREDRMSTPPSSPVKPTDPKLPSRGP